MSLFIWITDGRFADVRMLDALVAEPGSIYFFEQTYVDFRRLNALDIRIDMACERSGRFTVGSVHYCRVGACRAFRRKRNEGLPVLADQKPSHPRDPSFVSEPMTCSEQAACQ